MCHETYTHIFTMNIHHTTYYDMEGKRQRRQIHREELLSSHPKITRCSCTQNTETCTFTKLLSVIVSPLSHLTCNEQPFTKSSLLIMFVWHHASITFSSTDELFKIVKLKTRPITNKGREICFNRRLA